MSNALDLTIDLLTRSLRCMKIKEEKDLDKIYFTIKNRAYLEELRDGKPKQE